MKKHNAAIAALMSDIDDTMAGASLLALIDDIASVLDDVAVLTKAATKKTAGVLGDVLALNAQQVSGVRAERELPVVWAVAKGSARNKAILVPAALAISAFAPWAVTPLLMVGGSGTGKSAIIATHLLSGSGLSPELWVPVCVTLSARTSASACSSSHTCSSNTDCSVLGVTPRPGGT